MLVHIRDGMRFRERYNGTLVIIDFMDKEWKDKNFRPFLKGLAKHMLPVIQELSPELTNIKCFAFGRPVDYYESVRDDLVIARNADGSFTVKPGLI